MNGTFTSTVDRVVDGDTAVVLLESDGEVIDQLTVPVDRLPEPAQDDGGVLEVRVDDGEFVSAEYCPAKTRKRRESIHETLDRLSTRLPDK